MLSIIADFLLKSSYRSVYGDRANIVIKPDVIEVIVGNKKVIHNKKTGNKIEETFYEDNKMIVVRYNEEGKSSSEEVFVDGKKVSEKQITNGRDIIKDLTMEGANKTTSNYTENGVDVKEETYSFKDGDVIIDLNIKYKDKTITKTIKELQNNINVLDIIKIYDENERMNYYKQNNMEIEIEYYNDSKNIKTYSKRVSEPIYDETENNDNNKNQNQKNKNKNSSNPKKEKKQTGSKITKEVINYNEQGKILYMENNNECITREFDENGAVKKQYMIIDKDNNKEVVGKMKTASGIKIINNSTYPNERIIEINKELEKLESKYNDNLIMLYDVFIDMNRLELVQEYYQQNNELEIRKKTYNKLENNVPYSIEDTYKEGKIFSKKKTNKISKTELIYEGNRRLIKGMDGSQKEVSEEEFEIYKSVDELNKIENTEELVNPDKNDTKIKDDKKNKKG